MREVRFIMGMPVIIDIKDNSASREIIGRVFDYFVYVDEKFSTFKETSEITKINKGLLKPENYSQDMKLIFDLSEITKLETQGFFDIVNREGKFDPSGIVKGWAIFEANKILVKEGMKHFYVEAGGDIQVHGSNDTKSSGWSVGIRNPFNVKEIIKSVHLKHSEGIATSGSYERGNHIYNPKNHQETMAEIVSLTVIGPNVYQADRFATAAFAMQREGIGFIEKLDGFEGYMVDKNQVATMTSHFEKYL